jgi:hypothetical protein
MLCWWEKKLMQKAVKKSNGTEVTELMLPQGW